MRPLISRKDKTGHPLAIDNVLPYGLEVRLDESLLYAIDSRDCLRSRDGHAIWSDADKVAMPLVQREVDVVRVATTNRQQAPKIGKAGYEWTGYV